LPVLDGQFAVIIGGEKAERPAWLAHDGARRVTQLTKRRGSKG
jgi:hypothetical protein